MQYFADLMPWLSETFVGNSVADYFLSMLTFIAVWIGLSQLKRATATVLSRRWIKSEGHQLGYLIKLLSDFSGLVLLLVALFVATRRLELGTYLDLFIARTTALAFVLQVTSILSKLADSLIRSYGFGNGGENPSLASARTNLSAIVRSAIWIAGILFLISNFGIDVTAFVTGLGIGGIAIALAAQAILGDVFSSFTIAIDKPFEVGDFIVIDTLRGTIEQIGLKTTRIRSLDGELLVIPNSDLTKSRIQNFQKMQSRRINFKVGVEYGTSVEILREIPAIVQGIIRSIEKTNFERATFMTLGDFSLIFEIVYYVQSSEYIDYANIQQSINLGLCEEFKKRKIQFAFPTQTLHVSSSTAANVTTLTTN